MDTAISKKQPDALAGVWAAQQPKWESAQHSAQVREELAASPGLVNVPDVRTLHTSLAEVAAGRALVLHAGDCVEDPARCQRKDIVRKARLVAILARVMRVDTGLPVVRVGRIAGQVAKPWSRPVETR